MKVMCGSRCRSSLIRAEILWSQTRSFGDCNKPIHEGMCLLLMKSLKGWYRKRYNYICECFFIEFLFAVSPFEDTHSWNSQSVASAYSLSFDHFLAFIVILITVRKINWHQEILSFICYNFESKIIFLPSHLCNESLFQVYGLVNGN